MDLSGSADVCSAQTLNKINITCVGVKPETRNDSGSPHPGWLNLVPLLLVLVLCAAGFGGKKAGLMCSEGVCAWGMCVLGMCV